METSALSILVLIAFGLLIVLTGGVGYLTAMEWRDRRRRLSAERSLRSDSGRTSRSQPNQRGKK